jgi:BON domain
MAKPPYLLGVVLGTALASHPLAAAQAGTPDAKAAEIRQNPAGTPASQPSPVSAGTPSGPSGSAASSAGRGSDELVAAEARNTAVDSELQALIQDAMGRQAALAGSTVNVTVTVTAEGIELKGNVSSSRERLTAARLAHSYAGSRKVINHIVVVEPGGSAPPDSVSAGTVEANSPRGQRQPHH